MVLCKTCRSQSETYMLSNLARRLLNARAYKVLMIVVIAPGKEIGLNSGSIKKVFRSSQIKAPSLAELGVPR